MAPHRKLRLIVALAIAAVLMVAALQFNMDLPLRNGLPDDIRTTISNALAIIGLPGIVASIALRGNVHQPQNEVYYLVIFVVWAAIVYLASIPFIRPGK